MTTDDLTITEKVLSAPPPGSEWAWLIFFGLCGYSRTGRYAPGIG